MNPFRRSREFSLYRQMVFGDRAGAPDQRNPLWSHAFAPGGAEPQPVANAATEGDPSAHAESETE